MKKFPFSSSKLTRIVKCKCKKINEKRIQGLLEYEEMIWKQLKISKWQFRTKTSLIRMWMCAVICEGNKFSEIDLNKEKKHIHRLSNQSLQLLKHERRDSIIVSFIQLQKFFFLGRFLQRMVSVIITYLMINFDSNFGVFNPLSFCFRWKLNIVDVWIFF